MLDEAVVSQKVHAMKRVILSVTGMPKSIRIKASS